MVMMKDVFGCFAVSVFLSYVSFLPTFVLMYYCIGTTDSPPSFGHTGAVRGDGQYTW